MNKNMTHSYKQKGFSLVEMMIAMALGLVVLLAGLGSFMASQKASGMAQALSRNQEASRLAFELISKDLRVAGPNPCSGSASPINILNSGQTNDWWAQWENGIRGYAGGAAVPGLTAGSGVGQRAASSPVLDVYTADDRLTPLGGTMASPNSAIPMTAGSGFTNGELALICDTTVAFLFQITGTSGNNLVHSAGSGAPGNCSAVFSASDPCTNINDGHRFGWDALIGRVAAYRWYLGPNEAGGTSLWRARLTNATTGAVPSVVNQQEIARGVDEMAIEYLERGASNYVAATAVSDWSNVVSVRISLTLGQDIPNGSGGERRLNATTSHVVALRNR